MDNNNFLFDCIVATEFTVAVIGVVSTWSGGVNCDGWIFFRFKFFSEIK